MPGIGGNIIIYIHVITTGYYMITWKAKTSLSYIQCTPPPAPRGPEPVRNPVWGRFAPPSPLF